MLSNLIFHLRLRQFTNARISIAFFIRRLTFTSFDRTLSIRDPWYLVLLHNQISDLQGRLIPLGSRQTIMMKLDLTRLHCHWFFVLDNCLIHQLSLLESVILLNKSLLYRLLLLLRLQQLYLEVVYLLSGRRNPSRQNSLLSEKRRLRRSGGLRQLLLEHQPWIL